MTKQQYIELLRLLSALEGWSFASKQPIPEELRAALDNSVEMISREVLK